MCRCSKCNCVWCDYSTETKPCPNCGETKIYFTHFGILDIPTHEVLINVETNETISGDLCLSI